MDIKKIFRVFAFAIMIALSVPTGLMANEVTDKASMFELDESAMNDQLVSLDALEARLKETPEVTAAALKAEFTNLNSSFNGRSMAAGFDFDDIEWDAFAWGFCCFPVGMFTVVLNDESTNDDKASYWIGVLLFIVTGGGVLSVSL